MKLRYIAEIPNLETTAPEIVANYTNFIVVRRDRVAGYVFSTGMFPSGIDPNSPEQRTFIRLVNWKVKRHFMEWAQQPLAAFGLVYQPAGNAGTLVDYPSPYSLPNPDDTQFVFSIKSSVRTAVPLAPTLLACRYDSAARKFTPQAAAAPAGFGEFLFNPGDVGGLGYLRGIYNRATTVTTSLESYNYTPPSVPGGKRILVAVRGESVTLFAVTYDKDSNWVDNVVGFKWSLSFKAGAAQDSDLVVAPDGKSATYTANRAAPSAVQIRVEAAGYTTYELHYIQCEMA